MPRYQVKRIDGDYFVTKDGSVMKDEKFGHFRSAEARANRLWEMALCRDVARRTRNVRSR